MFSCMLTETTGYYKDHCHTLYRYCTVWMWETESDFPESENILSNRRLKLNESECNLLLPGVRSTKMPTLRI